MHQYLPGEFMKQGMAKETESPILSPRFPIENIELSRNISAMDS